MTSSTKLYSSTYHTLLPAIQQAQECQAIALRLLHHHFRLDAAHQLIVDVPVQISPTQQQQLDQALTRLCHQEPLQYVTGIAPFLGRDIHVSPAVLIPRPETEMLVKHIIDENPQPNLAILDLCTGSGCIAITLQQELPQASVHALDIDEAALAIAQHNAQELGANVTYLQADLLNTPLPNQHWDLWVSNPPYVRQAERQQMQRRVWAHEPAHALFVPDDRPLLFYERIATLAPHHLKPAGKIYLEINQAFGTAIAHLLAEAGFTAISIMPDLHGRDRWVQGVYTA